MIEEKFLRTIEEYKMFQAGDKVLVAVSGGADSTALLNLLFANREKLKISLHVAHLNHLLRRGDAELDAKYVENLAQKMSIPITVEEVDVAALAKQEKMGIEETARLARYDFYERTAVKMGANRIAVGHTADDNIETFLIRLLRGSGLRGLCGIPPRRGMIVRPLIKAWRKEIEDYVGGLKLVPRRDHTNYESKYMRNSVRLKLVPQLKIYNLNIKEIILQTILLVTEDNLYLENCSAEALTEVILTREAGRVGISIPKFRKLDPAVQRHVLRLAIEGIKGDLAQLNFGHVRDVLGKMDATEKWEFSLPDGVYVVGENDILLICRERPPKKEIKPFHYRLSLPGEIRLEEIGRTLQGVFTNQVDRGAPSTVAYVDYDVMGKEVIVRSKLAGDRFSPLGMKGTKKLQDFFVDEKIPAEEREAVPIVESGGRIIWVGGLRLDEKAKVTEKTKKIVKFELTCQQE